MEENKRYYYLYKITNILNQKIYIGVHSTLNLNDNYKGSGKYLKNAYKKYGKKNFKKEILEFFDSEEDMYIKEIEIVNRNFVRREDTYNIQEGGFGGSPNQFIAKDKNGNYSKVYMDDPKFESGELTHPSKGKVVVKDKNNKIYQIFVNDPRYTSGELVPLMCGTSPSIETREKISKARKGRIVSEETRGKLSKALKGRVHSIGTRKKMSESKTGRKRSKNSRKKQSESIKGKNNPFYGRTHTKENKKKMGINKGKITINKDGNNKRIAPNELKTYLEQGYVQGTAECPARGRIWMCNSFEQRMIQKEDINRFLEKGYKIGRKP